MNHSTSIVTSDAEGTPIVTGRCDCGWSASVRHDRTVPARLGARVDIMWRCDAHLASSSAVAL